MITRINLKERESIHQESIHSRIQEMLKPKTIENRDLILEIIRQIQLINRDQEASQMYIIPLLITQMIKITIEINIGCNRLQREIQRKVIMKSIENQFCQWKGSEIITTITRK